MKHLRYLKYVLRHKWYVFVECVKVGMFWRGLVHDLSKFSPAEWNGYVERFYGDDQLSEETQEKFRVAWKHHWQKNSHHWEHYLWTEARNGSGGADPMPLLDIQEMICDWRAMAKTVGNGNVRDWYRENRSRIVLNKETRMEVELYLGIDVWGMTV